MHLIVIVIALIAERAVGSLRRWRDVDGFAYVVRFIERSRLGARWLAHPSGVLVIVPPVALVAGLQWAIGHYLGLAAWLVFGVAVLLLSLGPRDLWEDVYALAEARDRADHDAAEARALALARRATGKRARDSHGETVLGSVLVQGHERVLAVLMWFFVAGPAGALFYRLVRELPVLAARDPATRATARTAEYIHGAAAFVPARLVAVIYALVGETRAGLSAWPAARATTHLSGSASWRLLARVGLGALGLVGGRDTPRFHAGLDDTLLEALALISRALLVLLAGFALLTIFGVLG